MDIKNADSWACHIHQSSDCKMKKFNNKYYHVKPIKDISAYAQTNFNSQNIPDEFWEDFEETAYMTPIAYASNIYREDIFKLIIMIFYYLDNAYLKYNTQNTASDFIKRHLVTDGVDKVGLCHKHLIRQFKKKGEKKQCFYTRDNWIRLIVKALFPKIDGSKTIPTNTPQWALYYLNKSDQK